MDHFWATYDAEQFAKGGELIGNNLLLVADVELLGCRMKNFRILVCLQSTNSSSSVGNSASAESIRLTNFRVHLVK